MACGLSLELAKIKAPVWRPMEPAKLADYLENRARKRQLKKILSKKARNKLWHRMQDSMVGTGQTMTRGEFLATVRSRFDVQS